MPVDDAWSAAMCELLLRGTAHALNNRIGVLGMVRDDLAAGRLDARLAASLGSELETLSSMSGALRALVRDAAPEEAIDLAELVPVAWRACRILGAISATVPRPRGQALPVRATRWQLMRVVVTMMRSIAGATTELTVELEGDECTTLLRVRAAATALAAEEVGREYARQLAAGMGGQVSFVPALAELRLPTLRERRRQDVAGS